MKHSSGKMLRRSILLGLGVLLLMALQLPQPAAALDVPAPLTPGSGVIVTATGAGNPGDPNAAPPVAIPVFSWTAVPEATSYRLEVSGQVGFNTLAIGVSTPHTRYVPISLAALPDGDWYWRVRAEKSGSQPSDYSSIMVFTKQWASFDNRPALLNPPEGDTIQFYEYPIFRWTPVIGAAQYRFQLSTSSDFASLRENILTLATTFQRTAKLENGTFYWRVIPVTVAGHEGTPSLVSSFNQSYTEVPQLIAPADNAQPVFTPSFRWSAVKGAQSYILQYSTDSNFTVRTEIVTPNTTYTPLTTIPNDVNYYWRVKAKSGLAESNWSTVRSFVKRWYIQPQLLTPTNLYQHNRFPVFSWTPVPGAAYYKIEYDTDNSFPNAKNALTSNTFYTPEEYVGDFYPNSTTWYWRVTPFHNGDRMGKTSSVFSYVSYADAEAPDLIYPLYYYQPNNFGSQYLGIEMHPYEDRTVPLPFFLWHRVYGLNVLNYGGVANGAFHIEVSTNDQFTNIVWQTNTENLAAAPTAANPFTPLANTDYFWRVCQWDLVFSECYKEPGNPARDLWSQTWRTRIDLSRGLAPRSPIALIRPVPNAELVETTPPLEWWPVIGADSYEVQISSDSSFAAQYLVDTNTVTHPLYAPTQNLAERYSETYGFLAYYWRVRALSGGSPLGAWSETRRFQIAAQSQWNRYRIIGNLDNRLPISVDATGDQANNNYDLTNLYAAQSGDYWYFGFNATANSAQDMTYALIIDADHKDNSGATSDPRGYATISTVAAHKPEFAIYIDQVQGEFLPSNIDIYEWDTINSVWKSPKTLEDVGSGLGRELLYPAHLKSVHFIDPSDGWAVGENGVFLRWDGISWTEYSPIDGDIATPVDLNAVRMKDTDDVWVLGSAGTIRHWEFDIVGGFYRWKSYNSPVTSDLYALTYMTTTTPADTAGWGVGANGKIIRLLYNPATSSYSWGTYASPYDPLAIKKTLYGVSNRWAVGQDGAILRWDDAPDSKWNFAGSPTSLDLYAVETIAANDAWAVGEFGIILHWDGASWGSVSSPTGQHLRAISMVSATDGWAAGDNGTILRWDGANWTLQTGLPLPSTTPNLYGISADASTVLVVGEWGADLLRSGGVWSRISDPLTKYIELQIPNTAIGMSDETGSYAVSLVSLPTAGGALQDSVPSDPNVPGSAPLSRFASVTERLNLRYPFHNGGVDTTTHPSLPPYCWDWPILAPWAGNKSRSYLDPQLTQEIGYYDIVSNSPYYAPTCYTWFDDFDEGDNTYYWRVQPRYLDLPHPEYFGTWSESYRFERKGFVPQNLAESVSFATPTFSWDMVEGALSYDLEVDNDPEFGNKEVSINTAQNTYTPVITLQNGSYYWRVRVRRRGGAINQWSTVKSFTLSLPQPTGLTPHDPTAANPIGTTPTFCWDALVKDDPQGVPVLAAFRYRMQVSRDPNFSVIYEQAETEQICYTPTRGYDDGSYYWRVAMLDGNGRLGEYSPSANFTKQYPVTTLLSPVDNSSQAETPMFVWSPVDGAGSYKMQVSQFPTFTPLYDEVTTHTTQYMPTKVYQSGRVYYWRVAIIDREGKIGPYNDATIILDPFAGLFKVYLPVLIR